MNVEESREREEPAKRFWPAAETLTEKVGKHWHVRLCVLLQQRRWEELPSNEEEWALREQPSRPVQRRWLLPETRGRSQPRLRPRPCIPSHLRK